MSEYQIVNEGINEENIQEIRRLKKKCNRLTRKLHKTHKKQLTFEMKCSTLDKQYNLLVQNFNQIIALKKQRHKQLTSGIMCCKCSTDTIFGCNCTWKQLFQNHNS